MKRVWGWLAAHRAKNVLFWSILDVAIITVAYIVPLIGRAITAPLDITASVNFIIVATIVTYLSLFANGVYRRIWSRTSGHSIVVLLRAVALAFCVLLPLDLLTFPRMLPISVLIFAHVFVFGGLVVIRYRSRLIGAFIWRWRAIWKAEFPDEEVERVLIVGAGESGQTIAMRLQHRVRNSGYKLIGFVDDDPEKYDMFVEGKRVLGKTSEITSIASEHNIQLIIVAIHNITGADMRRIIEQCQETKARIKVVPDMIQLMSSSVADLQLLRDIQPEDLIGRSIVKQHEGVNLEPIKQRIVLVTGAAGSIGSELCRQMLNFDPKKLIMLDNNESALHNLHVELEAMYPHVNIIPFLVDVTQYNDVKDIFSMHRPQLVFHAAAYKHVPMLEKYPNESIRVNVGGTLNVSEAALLNQAERFVLISTDKAVKPSSVMGASKRLCELLTHCISSRDDHSTLFTAVRFGNVLGSRGSVVPTFTRQIENGGPVTVTHKDMTRYFMSISEAANLVIHAAAMTIGDDIFVLRMGEEVRILDIAERMIRLRGLRPHVDIKIEYIGMRDGEKLHEELHTYYEKPNDTIHPKVMKINTWKLNGQSDQFMGDLSQLIHNGIPSEGNALEHLLELCSRGETEYQTID